MSGGATEYVMGYTIGASTVGGASGITSLRSGFFTNSRWNKHYDKYSFTLNINYHNRILEDTTGEMGPFRSKTDLDSGTRQKSSWYEEYASFTISSHHWFCRGSAWMEGSTAGAFAFGNYAGVVDTRRSFRLVLAP